MLKLVVKSSDKIKRSQDQQSAEDYQSWDPFTQAKFTYEINQQAGTPISRIEAYETASRAVTKEE